MFLHWHTHVTLFHLPSRSAYQFKTYFQSKAREVDFSSDRPPHLISHKSRRKMSWRSDEPTYPCGLQNEVRGQVTPGRRCLAWEVPQLTTLRGGSP